MEQKIKNIIEEIKQMKVTDLHHLVKAIETEFGVSAAAPVAAAGAGAAAAKTEKKVTLVNGGQNKVGVIKVVREVLGLGLMEAKTFVDKAPQVIKDNVPAEKADELAKLFKDAGAEVKVE